MKSILCVIDFSDSSINALKWAADISQQSKSYLHILYPFRLNQSRDGDERIQFKKQTEELAHRRFKSIEHDLLEQRMIDFDLTTEIGFLNDRVKDRINKSSLDLLVIGRSMTQANKETFEELIGHLKIPVVLVP